MKIIFLDFDGVLNTYWRFSTSGDFSKAACDNLNKILSKEKDAKIVVSSAWRKLGYKKVKDILVKNGIEESKIIDITPDDSHDRGTHILAWLEDHKDVKSYVVIDDEEDHVEEVLKKLVLTDAWVGLTETDAKRAIEILNEKD